MMVFLLCFVGLIVAGIILWVIIMMFGGLMQRIFCGKDDVDEQNRAIQQRHDIERQRYELQKDRESWPELLKELDIDSIEEKNNILKYIEKYKIMEETNRFVDIIWNGVDEVSGIKEFISSDLESFKRISSDVNTTKMNIIWDNERLIISCPARSIGKYKYRYADISNVYDVNKQLALVIFILEELNKRISSTYKNMFVRYKFELRQVDQVYYEKCYKSISVAEAYDLKYSGSKSEIERVAVFEYGYSGSYRKLTEL